MADRADTLHQADGLPEDESWAKTMFQCLPSVLARLVLARGRHSFQPIRQRPFHGKLRKDIGRFKTAHRAGRPRYEHVQRRLPGHSRFQEENPRAAGRRLCVVLLVAHPQRRTTLTAEAHWARAAPLGTGPSAARQRFSPRPGPLTLLQETTPANKLLAGLAWRRRRPALWICPMRSESQANLSGNWQGASGAVQHFRFFFAGCGKRYIFRSWAVSRSFAQRPLAEGERWRWAIGGECGG